MVGGNLSVVATSALVPQWLCLWLLTHSLLSHKDIETCGMLEFCLCESLT